MMCRTQDPTPKPHQLFHLSFVLRERGSRCQEIVFALHSSEVEGGLLDGKYGKELRAVTGMKMKFAKFSLVQMMRMPNDA